MSKLLIFLVLLIMMFGLVSGMTVDKSVLNAFKNGKSKVNVIIEKKYIPTGLGVMNNAEFDNKFPAYISEYQLKKLESDSSIIKIRMNIPIKTYLAQSVGIVGANLTWDLQNQTTNLTGISQSVCILDTGIDTSHPDFAGRILAEKCYCTVSNSGGSGCCPNGTAESNNASDDYGHGTHVAGIVGANGGVDGIAKNVGLVVVKIMNASGEGNSLDLENGLKWCINNSVAYNISVITASLGGADGFNSSQQTTCDNLYAPLTSDISDAYSKNISVTIATGNTGWTDKITWPACVSDVIPVGATDKSDNLLYNRNSFVKLFAPGYEIYSTYLNGGYATMNGTSMATPMVAGAIIIINQYLNLVGQTMTPTEIEDVLQKTGKNVSELGNDYSRINIYNAILSLDTISPNVGLISPKDNNANLTKNQTLVCNATDWQLSNVTLKVWNSTGNLYYNFTNNLAGNSNQTIFNLVNLSDGTYHWNCFAKDKNNNVGLASTNYSFVIGGVATKLLLPSSKDYTNRNNTNFSCNIESDKRYELSNVTFYIWNESGNLTYNLTKQIANFSNTTKFNYTLTNEGNYSWNCRGTNNASNESFGVSNFSIIYDITNPKIISNSQSTTTSGATIKWTTDEATNASLSLNKGSWSNSNKYEKAHSITISALSPSTKYDYTTTTCDKAGNCKKTSGSFTTKTVSHHSQSSSVSANYESQTPKIYKANVEEISKGYTKKLKKSEKINFRIFNFNGGNHSLTVNEVGTNYVNLTIRSNPINLKLIIGQSKELNLTSKNYYDLFVKLDNITDGKAKLTIKSISKPINKPAKNETKLIPIKTMSKKITVVNNNINSEIRNVLGILVLIIAILLLSKKRNTKKLKSPKKLKQGKQNGKNKNTKT